MREIVHIQVGQIGNQIGTQFWEHVAVEHGICPSGLHKSSEEEGVHQENNTKEYDTQLAMHGVYFEEAADNRYVPRAVVVDFDPFSVDQCRASRYGTTFNSDSFISGSNGTGLNWAKGYYTQGREHIGAVLDVVRRATEKCDSLQGFQLVHSLGGGCGSGFGNLLFERLSESYSNKVLCNFSYFPKVRTNSVYIVEPYNTVLSLSHMIESSSMMTFFEEPTIYDVCSRLLSTTNVKRRFLEGLVASVITDITSSFRFPSQYGYDFLKLSVNLIPFPRVKSLVPGYAPIYKYEGIDYKATTVSEITSQLFSERNVLCDVNPRLATCFRGNIDITSRTEQFNAIQQNSTLFAEWIPDSVVTAICQVPRATPLFSSPSIPSRSAATTPRHSSSSIPPHSTPESLSSGTHAEVSATSLLNTTTIATSFKGIVEQFYSLFRRNSMIHYYLSEGMDKMEFTEAESNLNDLVSEYEMGNGCFFDEIYEDEELE